MTVINLSTPIIFMISASVCFVQMLRYETDPLWGYISRFGLIGSLWGHMLMVVHYAADYGVRYVIAHPLREGLIWLMLVFLTIYFVGSFIRYQLWRMKESRIKKPESA